MIRRGVRKGYDMKKNLLVAQSGGPTAAINATLAGVIRAANESEEIDTVYGALYGIQGVLQEKFINLNQIVDTEEKLDKLRVTPAAALGSCRFKLTPIEKDDSQYRQIVDIFHKNNIGYFVYIGGNDSMDTVAKLAKYCSDNCIDDIQVIGGPKTIDNDLVGIDHCPGFGSAAKYIAAVFAELEQEMCVYDTKSVIVVEMMGRHAGWLTAAAALADVANVDVPYLIYLEERPFSIDRFIDDLNAKLKDYDAVMIAVSEGVHDENGVFICQRCASHILSATDIEESMLLGENAVKLAVSRQSGLMSSLRRVSDSPYRVVYEGVDIQKVANAEKKIPQNWINKAGNNVTQECINYLRPLVAGEMTCKFKDGVPDYMILK